MHMNRVLEKDLYRYEGERSKNFWIRLKYILFIPSFTYIYFFRKAQHTKISLLRIMYVIVLRLISYVTHIQIPYQTKIGEGFHILHFGTIVVSPYAQMGINFSISPGVVIGGSLGKKEGYPVIGSNVCVRANAIIIGGCKIGNNVLIAPGAFVNFDVPDNSIVIGNPGRIILRQDSPTAKYIIYPIV